MMAGSYYYPSEHVFFFLNHQCQWILEKMHYGTGSYQTAFVVSIVLANYLTYTLIMDLFEYFVIMGNLFAYIKFNLLG